jgi:O-methyltransferase
MWRKIRRAIDILRSPEKIFICDFKADGLAVRDKNLSFLTDPPFRAAWDHTVERNKAGWGGEVPNVPWRVHVACWAAQHCLSIEGDFAEFGVHTGIMSVAVCKYVDLDRSGKQMFLYDTFSGIPVSDRMSAHEIDTAKKLNTDYYFDCYEIAKANFADFSNARLVRGILPDSLDMSAFGKLSFVHVDLNNAAPEMAVISAIWDRISHGGIVLIDDYAFGGFEEQHDAWNSFAASKGHAVLTLPTGQGLVFRHA